jgi:hypothetical protein
VRQFFDVSAPRDQIRAESLLCLTDECACCARDYIAGCHGTDGTFQDVRARSRLSEDIERRIGTQLVRPVRSQDVAGESAR